jgi:hypothetical protein
MEYQASSQTDGNESISIVCLRDRQQLPVTNRHNVCYQPTIITLAQFKQLH